MLSYFLSNFPSNAFYALLFCHERGWGVSGRGNERKIRLTFSSSSHQYSWLNSVPTAQLTPLKGMGWELQAGVYARGNSDPGYLWILMSWSGTITYQTLFFCFNHMNNLTCSHISSERRPLFPFFRWRHFVFLGLDQLVGVTWRLCG